MVYLAMMAMLALVGCAATIQKGDHPITGTVASADGSSGRHRQRYTMKAFGQDVAAVVKQVGARNVILVGHSMGGPVAVEAAKQLGDRVAGIVGVDTFVYTLRVSSQSGKDRCLRETL